MEWVETSGWSFVLIVANFGAWQETPFLHVHLIRIGEPLTEFWDVQPNWLAVELEDDQQPFRAGRRVVRYNVLEENRRGHHRGPPELSSAHTHSASEASALLRRAPARRSPQRSAPLSRGSGALS